MAGMDTNRHTCPNPVPNLLYVIGKTQKKIHENKECFFFTNSTVGNRFKGIPQSLHTNV